MSDDASRSRVLACLFHAIPQVQQSEGTSTIHARRCLSFWLSMVHSLATSLYWEFTSEALNESGELDDPTEQVVRVGGWPHQLQGWPSIGYQTTERLDGTHMWTYVLGLQTHVAAPVIDDAYLVGDAWSVQLWHATGEPFWDVDSWLLLIDL
jgi:hypothetical protein